MLVISDLTIYTVWLGFKYMDMDDLLIREATVDDAAAIAAIHVQTWQHAYRGQIPDSYLDSLSVGKRTKYWEEGLGNPLEKSTTFVAEHDGVIIGFCGVGPSRDEDADDYTGELYAIYIDHNRLREGVGSALMEMGLEALVQFGFKKATLWVLETNEGTRKFYELSGWMADGQMKTETRGETVLKEVRYVTRL